MTKRILLCLAALAMMPLAASAVEVVRAEYGALSTWVDVTNRVRQYVRGNGLQFQVTNEALGGDPRPAEMKTLRLRFRDDSGRMQEQSFKEGDWVRIGSGGVGGGYFPGGGSAGGRDLRIVSAVYGVSGRYRDVAPQLRAMIRGDRLSVRASNESLGGDPAVGADKELRVVWEYRGQRRESRIGEDRWLNLPGDSQGGTGVGYSPGVGSSLDDLRIVSATYGVPGRNRDVTRQLRGQLRNGRLNMRVDNESIGMDPAVGAEKELVVSWEHRGQQRESRFREGQQINLPDNTGSSNGGSFFPDVGTGAGSNVDLRIISAQYGGNGRFNNVALRLREMVRDGRLNLRVSNETLGGDPAVGADKELTVVYDYRGQRQERRVGEGKTLTLP